MDWMFDLVRKRKSYKLFGLTPIYVFSTEFLSKSLFLLDLDDNIDA